MSDNPFAEPDDSDRTVIRPAPGGRRPPLPADTATAPPSRAPAPATPAIAEGPDAPAVGPTPLLAAAAPLLQLLARLRNTLTQPDPAELRERAVRELRGFEARAREAGVAPEQLRPAHYALCASLDDVVLNTPWGSAGGWDARSLVSTFHGEVRSGERFFDLLGQMRQNPGKFLPVIELMYLCLSLGFMGRTRLSPRGPAEIDRLREETYALIQRQRPAGEAALSPEWMGVSAPYRPARARLPVWVAGSVALAAVAALFAWFSTSLNAASDQVYAQAQTVPPAVMPAIARGPVVQPVAPAPAGDQPALIDRLRGFLKPEIDAGLVSVIGTQATPIVRVNNRRMFGSGSATVQPAALPVLTRIGAALKDEPGAVQVIGYTDNEPIRTVRFPSNFQLSAARAQAAAAIVARGLGGGSRISVEGRADADPVASNATPEGREQNRRIEIVLRRAG